MVENRHTAPFSHVTVRGMYSPAIRSIIFHQCHRADSERLQLKSSLPTLPYLKAAVHSTLVLETISHRPVPVRSGLPALYPGLTAVEISGGQLKARPVALKSSDVIYMLLVWFSTAACFAVEADTLAGPRDREHLVALAGSLR